ncbi:MAG TPA: hypothetical protein DD453_12370 [Alteromonas macleodii]|jgi:hypothetical protein|nr:hypothetical protein AMBLS11_01310 [Alteromonas macleodii str. 'Black Sea 11']MAL71183.1 hypothetical protein [Alteromonas sp.]MEE3222135.1 hypothetical protein [Pseudomonadota bacterium]HAA98603.1 hypothetical protein [Alteromonas macleodii]MBS08384.1 hypothetical protein [Alteromonas sp.]|tara:strand:- start:2726 stop:2947 length:222 start_codon:yes stop_codon:yes gene_type:complete
MHDFPRIGIMPLFLLFPIFIVFVAESGIDDVLSETLVSLGFTLSLLFGWVANELSNERKAVWILAKSSTFNSG